MYGPFSFGMKKLREVWERGGCVSKKFNLIFY